MRTIRIFLGLELPEAIRNDIVRWANTRNLPGIREHTANLHMTLVFMGETDMSKLPALHAALEKISFKPFTMSLNVLRRWRNGILHLAPSKPPRELGILQAALKNAAVETGANVDNRAFSAHLTLARAAPKVKLGESPPFTWTVDRVTLFTPVIDDGMRVYRDIGSWPAEVERPGNTREESVVP